MRNTLLSAAAVMAAALPAAPAAALVLNFPAAGSNSFIALYEIDSGHDVCNVQCTIVSSPGQSVSLAPTAFTAPGDHTIGAGGSVTPQAMRGFVSSSTDSMQLDLAMRDTYTVMGGGFDPFPVTARMHVTGTLGAVPFGPGNFAAIGPNVDARIGEFHTNPAVDLLPAVAGFGVPGASGNSGALFVFSGPDFSQPFAFDVFYTQMVRQGDVFTLAYGVSALFSRAEIDFQNTAAISFDTPDGVFLNAVSGAQFGDLPAGAVPEPASWALMLVGFGLGGAALRARRRSVRAAMAA